MDDRAIAITDFLKLLTGLFYKFKQSGKANVTLISDWVKNRWQSDPEGLYTVADPSDTVIGEADLSETLAEAPTLNDIFKFLISRVPGLEEATNKLARPALIIDKKAKKVSLIDMAADPVTVQSEPAPEPSQV